MNCALKQTDKSLNAECPHQIRLEITVNAVVSLSMVDKETYHVEQKY